MTVDRRTAEADSSPPTSAGGDCTGVRERRDLLRGDSRERIAELQRARILSAVVELVRERGIAKVTVSHVVSRSKVSRRTFYEHFEDRDACCLAAVELAFGRLAERVGAASEGAVSWRGRVRAALAELLAYLEAEPQLGALCIVDALAAGPAVLERRAAVLALLVDAVHEGRREAGAGRRPTRLAAEGVVGAVLSVLHNRLLAGEQSYVKLLNHLMAMIVLPYLGSTEANRELEAPAPRRRRAAPAETISDPLRELDMRLTYRTVRVLLAIAELGGQGPSPNSREVADASGVSDQGQISKMLWRLEHLGLIANGASRPARGESNAWVLTDKGCEVQRAIVAQTGG
jgi:AcrR family transcriptional regulator